MTLERQIQNELHRLDRNLFLDKEIRDGKVLWMVREVPNRDFRPDEFFTIFEWSDVYGNPLPLSLSIVDRVKILQGGNIKTALNKVNNNNNSIKEQNIREKLEIQETISREFQKSAKRLHISGPWAPKHDVTAYKKLSR